MQWDRIPNCCPVVLNDIEFWLVNLFLYFLIGDKILILTNAVTEMVEEQMLDTTSGPLIGEER